MQRILATLEIVTTSIRSPEQSFRYKSPSSAGTNKYLKTCNKVTNSFSGLLGDKVVTLNILVCSKKGKNISLLALLRGRGSCKIF